MCHTEPRRPAVAGVTLCSERGHRVTAATATVNGHGCERDAPEPDGALLRNARPVLNPMRKGRCSLANVLHLVRLGGAEALLLHVVLARLLRRRRARVSAADATCGALAAVPLAATHKERIARRTHCVGVAVARLVGVGRVVLRRGSGAGSGASPHAPARVPVPWSPPRRSRSPRCR